MGSVVDYYKPIPCKSFCEMLQANNLHLWSADGKNWVEPNYYAHKFYKYHLGGSQDFYPSDGRQLLSFWGSRHFTGGCCVDSYTDGSGAWKRKFDLYYALGMIIL